MIKGQIELQLRQQNRKSQIDQVDLKQLKPDFTLKLNSDIKQAISKFKSMVADYVTLHNDYCRMKINEEKAKAKRPKVTEEKLE